MIPVEFPKISFDPKFFRDIGAVQAAIELLGRKFDDFSEPLRASLELVILPSIRENFNVGGRPKWAPLSSPYRTTRQPKPILIQSGRLFRATQSMTNWTVTRDTVEMTGITGAPYAGYHQSGTRKMPARPFVMYQPEDVDDITQIFEIWVDGIVDQYWSTEG
jgi:phage gpG-like protein